MHNSIISISWWQVVRLKAAEEPFVGPFLCVMGSKCSIHFY